MKNRTLTMNAGKVEPAKLVNLKEHNAKIEEAYRISGLPRLNGIACPGCGKEMLDSSPSITLTTAPPQKYVHCGACGYQSTRNC